MIIDKILFGGREIWPDKDDTGHNSVILPAPDEIVAVSLEHDGTVLTASLPPPEADGRITSTCNGVPIKDGQSNFGSGYSYQYGAYDTINVLLADNEWHVFVLVDAGRTIDMDSFSEQERMELDPTYIPDNEGPEKPNEEVPANVPSPIDGVTMEVTECSNTSVTVKIVNDTDKYIQCGDDFCLEIQDEETGDWREAGTGQISYCENYYRFQRFGRLYRLYIYSRISYCILIVSL